MSSVRSAERTALPSAPALRVVVPHEAHGTRLDRFLAAALLGNTDEPLSRSELQQWIDAGLVTVAGATKKSADRVKEGDTVMVLRPAPRMTQARPDSGVNFEVLYEDEWLVVLVKPAGLVVHPSKGHETGTLVNGLLARGYFDLAKFPGDENPDSSDYMRPGIVHRLDRGTSGVMVVARNPRAREKLRVQFAEHTIDRRYEAICIGRVAPRTYDTFHGRHPKDRMKFSSKVRTGKRAVTHVDVTESFALATHVTCRLETGRTHQIRVHLADGGNAILGDPLYAKVPKDQALRDLATSLGRQALHARVLGFTHPVTDRWLRFDSTPPADFQVALSALRAMPL